MTQRNEIFDMMKGVAILLMMYAHLVLGDTGTMQHIIYSFHMPLFFILAGIFAKELEAIPSFKQYSIKNAKRLLVPFYVTMLMRIGWGCVQAYCKHNVSYIIQPTLSMLAASPDGWHTQWGLVYAGPMWFLVSLFWVREIFYGIQYACKNVQKYQDELILGIAVALSIISVIVRPNLPSLPFGVLQAFTAVAFYAVGWYVHKYPVPWWVYAISVVVWPLAIRHGQVALDCCCMTYYPLSFVGACGGTYMIYLLCKGVSQIRTYIKERIVSLPGSLIGWCGIYSLPILCMHELEMYSDIYYSVMCRLPISCERAWGGVIAILFAYIVINTPILKDVYK